MFKHPKCGGSHETVHQARECEANIAFAAEIEANHEHFLRTGRDETPMCTFGQPHPRASQICVVCAPAPRDVRQAVASSLRNGHSSSPILASLRGARAEVEAEKFLQTPERLATEAQERFVQSLIAERDPAGITDVEFAEAYLHALDGKALYFREARTLIEALKAAPKLAEVKAERTASRQAWRALAEQVPNGRYALPTGPGQDKPHFYRVSRNGSYVKLQEQASDALHEVPLKHYAEILGAIVAYGTERSGVLYAELISACRRCGRALTDQDNPYLAAGYGPECGAKK